MEPVFRDESTQLPQEIHPSLYSKPTLETQRGRNTAVGSGGDGSGSNSDNPSGSDGSSAQNMTHQLHHQEYSRYSVHLVTQYYVPEDPRRALEVRGFLRGI